MAVRYRVTKACFYNGCYREPGSKHALITVDKKFSEKDKPSFLELIDEKPAPKKKVAAKKESAPIEEPVQDDIVSVADTEVI